MASSNRMAEREGGGGGGLCSSMNAPSTAAQRSAQRLIETATLEQKECLEKALVKWYEHSAAELAALQAEGLSETEAVETIVCKLTKKPVVIGDMVDEANSLINIFDGSIDSDAALRIIRVRKEVTALREKGMDRPSIILELLNRLEKPAGYKRAGRVSISPKTDPGPVL